MVNNVLTFRADQNVVSPPNSGVDFILLTQRKELSCNGPEQCPWVL